MTGDSPNPENHPNANRTPLDRKMLIKGAAAATGTVVALFALLFLSAGTWDWWPGWAHLALWTLYMGIGAPLTMKFAPDLMKRRMKFGPGAEEDPDQKVFMAVAFPTLIGLYIVAGLDRRFGWSAMPTPVIVAGMAFVVAGMALAVTASLYNHYAAATITVEKGQPVIDTGPYAWVRHPMYSGVLLWFAATPLALGSWWALVLTVLMAIGLYFRISGEERHLLARLPGYEAYCRKVRWRLCPGLW